MNIINKPQYVAITGVGKAKGELEIDNAEMSRLVEQAILAKCRRSGKKYEISELTELLTNAEWIETRTGIKRRAFSCKPTSELAAEAARQALDMSGLRVDKIDAILFATVSPDFRYSPPTASLLHRHLAVPTVHHLQNTMQLKNCITCDFGNACTSFGTALLYGYSLIKANLAKHLIVVGADRMSTTIDLADRAFSVLLGDGAGVFVLEAVEQESRDSFPFGQSGFVVGTDPSGAMNIVAKEGGSSQPLTLESLTISESNPAKFRQDMLWQDGRKVYKEIINLMVGNTLPPEQTVVGRLLSATGMLLSDIDIAFFHQANLRINKEIEDRMIAMGLKRDVVYNTISEVGNTTSAALPYGVAQAYEVGRLKCGMTALLAAFGGGYTWALVPIRWTLLEPC